MVDPVVRRGLFPFAVALSAALVFVIQPLVGRLVLPLLGGSAASWTTCLLFFQGALLAGYLWAHLQRRLPGPLQRWGHVLLLLAGAGFLPLTFTAAAPVSTDAMPAVWLLGLLAMSCGTPLMALAGNASTLQRWYAELTGRSPYGLYAVSNAASLAGLLAYPLLLEPTSSLTNQRYGWSALYIVEIVAVALCARLVRPNRGDRSVTAVPGPASEHVARWIVLAAVPASLVAGVTAHVTSELAPVPLLWVVALAIYLVTFIAAFGGRPIAFAQVLTRLFPLVALPIVAIELSRGAPWWSLLGLHLAAFGLVAALCHSRLWMLRPSAEHLTFFYLWVAVGGALGGLFNAVIAPLVFTRPLEYPLGLIAGVVVLALTEPGGQRADRVALGIGVTAVLAWLVFSPASNATVALSIVALFAALPALRRTSFKFGGAAVVVVLFARVGAEEARLSLHYDRSFYASLRVIDDFKPGVRALVHGTTLHGLQARDPAKARVPLSYYTDRGPIGETMIALGPALDNAHVGVVGLGAGELASRTRQGQQWTFFEIDPVVVRLASDPRWFTYLSSAAVRPLIVLGDGRRSLAASDEQFRLLVVDAFTSDAIPIHLLTRQAFGVYLRRLEREGVLAFHISNRFIDLEPVLGALARDARMEARTRFDEALVNGQPAQDRMPSRWIVMARPGMLPAALHSARGWYAPAASERPPWTDDRSDILSALSVWR